MTAVIPGRSNRKVAIVYDPDLYGERHLVEHFIGKVQRYRRVFTRFEQSSWRCSRRHWWYNPPTAPSKGGADGTPQNRPNPAGLP